ncbi:MAG: hypothetical protein P1U53_11170 [Sulfitobacter sp.]|nr:hypothetical protein [Sulfitobacter sp.]
MSDPVTNAEVEDVLSSIRRLVSEDKRPLQGRAAQPEASDRLVLTPALRVEPPARRPADTPQEPLSLKQRIEEDSTEDTDNSEEIGKFDEDYSGDPYGFDSEEEDLFDEGDESSLTTSDEDGDATDGFLVEEDPADEIIAEAIHGAAEEQAAERSDLSEDSAAPSPVSSDNIDEESAEKPSRAASLSEKIAQLETAIGNISEDWEPDDPGADDYAGTDAPAMAWEDDSEVHNTFERRIETDYSDDGPEARDVTPTDEPEAAPRKPFAATPVTDFSKVTGAFASHSRGQQSSEAQEGPAPDRTGPTLDLNGDEQLIDEEMLRDLVSEIVRAELQGALGERITRNVRKLVRREIHRALTAQDLE